MKPHYIQREPCNPGRLFIPMWEWNPLKSERYEMEEVETYEIPDWQKEIVLKRMEAYRNGKAELVDFEEAMNEIEKNL